MRAIVVLRTLWAGLTGTLAVAWLGAGCTGPAAVADRSGPGAGLLPAVAAAVCGPAAQAPVIDGVLDDPAWRTATVLGPFSCFGTKVGPPVHPTTVRLCWDAAALYVAFDLCDPDVWSALDRHDAYLWEGEVAEIYVDPDGDGRNYREIEINPLNAVVDLNIGQATHHGVPMEDVRRYIAWDAEGLRTAVRVEGTVGVREDTDSGWRVEVAMPWACLTGPGSGPPRPGDRWRVQFLRIDRSRGLEQPEFSGWSPTPAFHAPERFGWVTFAGAGP